MKQKITRQFTLLSRRYFNFKKSHYTSSSYDKRNTCDFTEINENLQKQLKADLMRAMRSKDIIKRDVLKQIQSEIINAGKMKNTSSIELSFLEILQKCQSKWIKAKGEYEGELLRINSKADYISTEKLKENLEKICKELEIINSYLPKKYSTEELTEIVKKVIEDLVSNRTETEISHGLIIKEVLKTADDLKVDKTILSKIVREIWCK